MTKKLLSFASIIVVVSITTFGLSLLSNILGKAVNPDVSADIVAALDAGTISSGGGPFDSEPRKLGVDTYSDCTIFTMLLLDQATSQTSFVSPPRALRTYEDQDPCLRLIDVLDNIEIYHEKEAVGSITEPYHQYIHLQTDLTRAILSVVDVGSYRKILKYTVFGVYLATFLYSIVALIKARELLWLHLGITIISITALLLSGIHFFGVSPSSAWPMIVTASILFCSQILKSHAWEAHRWVWFSSISAAAALSVDFMNGGIPASLTIVLAIAFLSTIHHHSDRRIIITVVLAGFTYTATTTALFFLNYAAGVLSWSGKTAHVLSDRAESWFLNFQTPFDIVFTKLAFFTRHLGFFELFEPMIIIFAIIFVSVTLAAFSALGERRLIVLPWLFVCAVVPIWIVVFLEHVNVHAFMMVSMLGPWLGVILATSICLFFLSRRATVPSGRISQMVK